MDSSTTAKSTPASGAAPSGDGEAAVAAAIPALVPRSRAAATKTKAATIIGGITAAHEAKVSKLVMDSDTVFTEPKRAIFNEHDLEQFQKSQV